MTDIDLSKYADRECEGCLSGEDCYGWTSETRMCPSRIPADRELEAFQAAAREFEDEHGMVGSAR